VASRCPFLGYHWPAESNELVPAAEPACGLDIDENAPCQMVAEGQTPDYYHCPFVRRRKPFLDVFLDEIRFRQPGGERPLTLDEMLQKLSRRRP
jgi:hypothetical protein